MAEISTQQEAQSWYSVITDFPNYWDNLQKNYQGLLAQADYIYKKHPELKSQYDSMVNEGSTLFNRMNAISNSIANIKSSWNNFTGWLKGAVGLSSLGILPVIPLAIGAATAGGTLYLVGQWLTKAAEMAKRIDLYKSEEAKGLSPQQAASNVDLVLGKPTSGSIFGIPIKWIFIGGIAIILLPSILPFLKGRK
jgi:hypothetical protein